MNLIYPKFNYTIDDIDNGCNEWTNIQHVIRNSFIVLTNCIENQNKVIEDLHNKVENKLDKDDLELYNKEYINKDLFNEKIKDIDNKINNKINIKDFEIINKDNLNKRELEYIRKIDNEKFVNYDKLINNKTDKREINIIIDNLKENQNKIKENMSNYIHLETYNNDFKELKEDLSLKISLNEINHLLDNKVDNFKLQKELENKINYEDFENKLLNKADTDDVDNIINIIEKKSDISDIDKIYKLLNDKPNKNEFLKIEKELNNKSSIKNELNLKTNFKNLKVDFERFSTLFLGKLDILKKDNINMNEYNNKIIKEIENKANNIELEKLKISYKNKLDIEESNRMFKSIQSEFKLELSNKLKNIKDDFFNQNDENIKNNNIIKSNINKLQTEIINMKIFNENIINDRQKELNDLQNLIKNNSIKLKNDINHKQEILNNDIDFCKENINKLLENSTLNSEFYLFQNNINKEIKNKISLNEVQNVINNYQLEISEKILIFKKNIKEVINNKDLEMKQILIDKVSKSKNDKLLDNKLDKVDLESILIEYVKNDDIKMIYTKLDILNEDGIFNNGSKIYSDQINLLQEKIINIIKDLSIKADLKEVCQLIDQKANVDEINTEFEKIYLNINKFSNKDDLKNIIQEQSSVNEFLCAENIKVRYRWKSGNLINGNFVPWENQTINTLPDNFILENNKYNILITTTGLYEVIINFYCNKKPIINLLINGENILTSNSNQNSKIIQIKGSKIIEYLLIPARSQISVMFQGEGTAEGFINIKRL